MRAALVSMAHMRFEVQAIVFDIDGTLVDSTPAVERSWRTWCGIFGVDADALLSVSHGRRSADTIALFLPADRVDEAVKVLDEIELRDLDGILPLPNAAHLTALLPEGRWALVTSGNRGLMRERISAGGIPIPEVMITSEDVERGKPDPQGYRRAAELLGFDPATCLVVEDAPPGVDAGVAAGSVVLAVGTSHPLEALPGAHAYAADLSHVEVSVCDDGLVVEISD